MRLLARGDQERQARQPASQKRASRSVGTDRCRAPPSGDVMVVEEHRQEFEMVDQVCMASRGGKSGIFDSHIEGSAGQSVATVESSAQHSALPHTFLIALAGHTSLLVVSRGTRAHHHFSNPICGPWGK